MKNNISPNHIAKSNPIAVEAKYLMESATSKDRADITEIWEQCFGDPKEYINLSLDANLDKFIVYKIEGKAVSMLCVIPCMYGSARGGYVYAVATLPKFRGKGYSRQLLAFTEAKMKQQGYDFSCLVPATNPLFNFYSHQGYKTGFYCSNHQETFHKNGSEPLNVEVQKIDVQEFISLKQILSNEDQIAWSREHLKFLYEENAFLGGEVLKISANGKQGIAVLTQDQDKVLVKELIISPSQIEKFAKLITQKYKKDCFIRAQATNTSRLPFGMIKYFNSKYKNFNGYISLVLD